MDLRFFHPGRVESLAIFFSSEAEKKEFFSELDDETKAYLLMHADEFHSREELENMKDNYYKRKNS